MKSVKLIFGLTLFISIVLCSLLVAAETIRDKNFCSVFWGSLLLLIVILICFTICICKEKDTKYEIEKLKLEKLDKLTGCFQLDGNFDSVEVIDEKEQTKTITQKNQILANQLKSIASLILEL